MEKIKALETAYLQAFLKEVGKMGKKNVNILDIKSTRVLHKFYPFYH